MGRKMNIWFDEEGDFLEISTSRKKGHFKDVGNDVFERVDTKGNIIGFAIFNFSKRTKSREDSVSLPFEFKIKPVS